MIYLESGTAVDILIPLKQGDEFVTPIVGTTTYTVRDHTGVPIAGHQDVPVATDDTTDSVTVSLTSGETTISGSLERRTVVVDFKHSEGSERIIYPITLTPWLNINISLEDIRSTLGVDSLELPDADIQIPPAYFAVEDILTSSVLEAALAETNIVCLQANQLIKLKVCLNLMPSMVTRVAQRIASGENIFDRVKGIDFDALEYKLSEEYSSLLSVLSGVTDSSPTILLVPAMTDPITG